jgi:MPBQ/MSBQ methyltransferase
LAELLDSFASGLDVPHRIDDVLHDLREAGFTEVTSRSVGEHVWPGFDRWIALTEHRDGWGRNWIPVVRRGLADYFLVTARKPAGSGS